MNMDQLIAMNDRQLLAEAKPCPFCGSKQLVIGEMWITFEAASSVECERCKASAPFDSWQRRFKGDAS